MPYGLRDAKDAQPALDVHGRIAGQREDAVVGSAAKEDGPAVDAELRALRFELAEAKGHLAAIAVSLRCIEIDRQRVQRRTELVPFRSAPTATSAAYYRLDPPPTETGTESASGLPHRRVSEPLTAFPVRLPSRDADPAACARRGRDRSARRRAIPGP